MALPAAFAELLRQGTASAEQGAERTDPTAVAPSARKPSANRQSASQQNSTTDDSKRDSFAMAAGSNGGNPPTPDALSWFLCTDEIVKPVSWETVARCEAYILLYMRIH